MRAHFKLPSIQGEDLQAKPPIEVKFEIPYFTTSGIQVNYYFLYINFIQIFRFDI
jgi:AP-1 complex subunit mu